MFTNIAIGSEVTLLNRRSGKERDLIGVVSASGCIEITSHKLDVDGYIPYRRTYAHRLVYEEYIGELKNGYVVRHKCDNKRCCNPSHLESGRQLENILDIYRRDRNPNTVTYELAKSIAECKGTVYEIMNKFNVSRDVVYKIKRNIVFRDEFSIQKLDRPVNKLTPTQVVEIYKSELSGAELGRLYGVHSNTIYDIKKGRIWSKLTENIEEGN